MKRFYYPYCVFSFTPLANESKWLSLNINPIEKTQQNSLQFSILPNPVKNKKAAYQNQK